MQRNAQQTRQKLVQTAYEQIHEHGFQGMRVDQVLKQAELQKGAFYHHFKSKTELGYAVVEESLQEILETVWLEPIRKIENPIIEIPKLLETLGERATPLIAEHGCPLNNLAQEMSLLDEGFRSRIAAGFELWINTLTQKLDQAKEEKYIRHDINSEAVARFIIAVIEGSISIAKVEKSTQQFIAGQSQLSLYLQALQIAHPR